MFLWHNDNCKIQRYGNLVEMHMQCHLNLNALLVRYVTN